MIGKRIKDGEFPENPGEYSKHRTDRGIVWFATAPKSGMSCGSLMNHTVVEHEDETITVTPSIIMDMGDGQVWHGYLEHGIWREC